MKIKKYIKRCLVRAMELLPDKPYLKLKYRFTIGKRLNLKTPTTYTEKLQWIKIYDRNPIYTTMVDKCEAKKFVAERIGEEYIIPTYGVWDSFDEINFNMLPNQFVLKCTHDSGSIVICKDKSKFDYKAAKIKLTKGLRANIYRNGREWPYKNVKPRIIAEKYMIDTTDGELRDYKFFTFGGVPRILYIAQGRGLCGETFSDFFDMDFNHLDLKIDHENAPSAPHKPQNFEKMKELARLLSNGTPELRVDFYEVDGMIYFGEMTFFHCGGFAGLRPDKWDYILGSWIDMI